MSKSAFVPKIRIEPERLTRYERAVEVKKGKTRNRYSMAQFVRESLDRTADEILGPSATDWLAEL